MSGLCNHALHGTGLAGNTASPVHRLDPRAKVVALLMGDEAELAKMRAGAKTSMQQLAGALDSTAEALLKRLPPVGAGVRRAS